ncbi:hypothetical protein ACIRF8_10420 [Streptomyces sp. NPDC102406]
MGGTEQALMAVGGRAPDFVPVWVQVLLVVVAFGAAGLAWRRRNRG